MKLRTPKQLAPGDVVTIEDSGEKRTVKRVSGGVYRGHSYIEFKEGGGAEVGNNTPVVVEA